jgi:hypothetical protein
VEINIWAALSWPAWITHIHSTGVLGCRTATWLCHVGSREVDWSSAANTVLDWSSAANAVGGKLWAVTVLAVRSKVGIACVTYMSWLRCALNSPFHLWYIDRNATQEMCSDCVSRYGSCWTGLGLCTSAILRCACMLCANVVISATMGPDVGRKNRMGRLSTQMCALPKKKGHYAKKWK